MNDLESRLHGLWAAGRYCSINKIDPDDEALVHWHEGRMSENLLLNWKADSREREESRIIAVSVADAVWQIEKGPEGTLEESPLFNALSEIIGERVVGIIDQSEFAAKVAQLIPVVA
jgi:hypothetical protein